MKKIDETGSLLDTDPSLYVGYDVDPKTGQMVKKGKEGENDMSDPKLHQKDGVLDEPPKPAINVQAEAYKPGFVIYLVEEPLDEYMLGGDPAKKAGDANPHKKTKNNAESVDSLKTLNHMHHLCETYPQVRMVFEDTVTGEKGYVTPAMFVKIYSKLLQEGNKKEQPAPMSESKTPSKSANLPLANELMNVGLVNNVKGTAQVLREENPFRKAMEIFYASEKSNANADEKKAAYVPSQLKEGKMVLDKSKAVAPEKEPAVETKKKRPVIW